MGIDYGDSIHPQPPRGERRHAPQLKEALVNGEVSFANIADNLISIGLFQHLDGLKYPNGAASASYEATRYGNLMPQEQVDGHRHFFQGVLKVAMPEDAIASYGRKQIQDADRRKELFAQTADMFKANKDGRLKGIRFPTLQIAWEYLPDDKSYVLDASRYEQQSNFSTRGSESGIKPAMARVDGDSIIFTRQEEVDFFLFCANQPEVFLAMTVYYKAITSFLEKLQAEFQKRFDQGSNDITAADLDDFKNFFIGQVSINNFVSDLLQVIVLYHLNKTNSGNIDIRAYKKKKSFPPLTTETVTEALAWASSNKLFSQYLRKSVHALSSEEVAMKENAIDASVQVTCPARTFVLNTLKGENVFTDMMTYLAEHPDEVPGKPHLYKVIRKEMQTELSGANEWYLDESMKDTPALFRPLKRLLWGFPRR